jgi:hypothetical protein
LNNGHFCQVPRLAVVLKFDCTVKLGYNKQLGVAKFVCYNQEFIITRVVYGIMHRFGTKKFVHYKREFVITEFVIAKFDCIFK